MLEVGEPGELPLMRELIALKKSKGLQDPSTVSRKSPVLDSSSSLPTNEAAMQQPHEEVNLNDEKNVMMMQRHHASKARKRDPSRGKKSVHHRSTHEFDASYAELGARMGWELGMHQAAAEDSDEEPSEDKLQSNQNESLRSHLEKLGILGESRGFSRGNIEDGSSLLHNWRTPDHHDTGDDDYEFSAMVDGLDLEVSRRNRHGVSNDSYDPSGHTAAYPPYYNNEDGRKKAVHNSLRPAAPGYKLRSQNDQVLSPLLLNPHDDLRLSGHAHSSFTLEESSDNEDEHDIVDEWAQTGMITYQNDGPYQMKQRPKSRFSNAPASQSGHRQQRKQQTESNVHGARAGKHVSSKHMSQPWEAEFFDYEVEALEKPLRKDTHGRSAHGLVNHRSKSHKQIRNQPAGPQESSGSCHDPATTGAARRKGSGNGQAMIHKQLMPASYNGRSSGTQAEPLPLLTDLEDYNGSDEYGGSSVEGDVRLSSNQLHGELELESCNNAPDRHNAGRIVKVQTTEESLQLAIPDCKELALCEYRPRNLSQKYRPKAFEELVGQHIVTQALANAILKGKIAPVYLFQGSRGTGKTSAARIFASALICISSEGQRPCGACRECISVATGKCSEVKEVDAASNNGIERVKALLEETISSPPLSRYKVFIIDECHVLTTETWNALLKILEEPPMNVVFILITTDPDRLPRTAVSRCQKFPFPKIKESEIVRRLQKLAASENFSVDVDTLQLIASRSDGSLRDAEMTLDQVSLLGQQINTSTVYELVGSASDERMLSLLDSALLADTVNTVRKARELIDAGVEPLSLMSQLATLVTDILAGTFKFTDQDRKGFFRKQSLSEEKLERLRMAMKTFSEAEKQLRVSNDRATWLTAALLQLGPERNAYMFTGSCAGTSVTQSPIALDDAGDNDGTDFDRRSSGRQTWAENDSNNLAQNMSSELMHSDGKDEMHHVMHPNENMAYWGRSSQQNKYTANRQFIQSEMLARDPSESSDKQHYQDNASSDEHNNAKLDEIWLRVVDRCRSHPLRQLLCMSVKLVSISISEVTAVVHLEVCHPDHKATCERSHKTIANLFESVIGFPVEIRTTLASLPADLTGYGWTSQSNVKSPSQQATNGNTSGSSQSNNSNRPVHDIRRMSPMQGTVLGDFSNPRHQITHKDIAGDALDNHMGYDPYTEQPRSLDDIEALSLESHELVSWHNKISQPYCVDGRRSCDASLPKPGGNNNFKMVRRLSMRGQAMKSSPPLDDKGSSMRVPRFSSKSQLTPQKDKSSEYIVEGSELGVVEHEELTASQKKGKFKGSFARFFQGKLSSKQATTDTSSRTGN